MSDARDRERWQRAKTLFAEAAERPPAERERFLDQACKDDPAMRREVESLLAAHEGAGALLEQPPRAGSALARAGRGATRPPGHLTAGQQVGPYQIVAPIGAGGMGEVYRARDTRLHRDVALKVLPPALTADAGRRHRFVQEARAASALEHPHIAVIHEIGEDDGITYIAMELVRGEPLSAVIARGPFTAVRALDLAIEMAEALARAHETGIVHRDLKPANVMLTEEGHAKIIDFGLAKLLEAAGAEHADTRSAHATESGLVLGTASYMSPEQVRGERADQRSDVFSFGIVLYEMLTGNAPFRGRTGIDTMHAILHTLPAALPTSVGAATGELQRILDKCLAKEPAERYQGMRDLVVDLRATRRRIDSGQLPRYPPLDDGSRPARPRRARLWLGASAAAAAVIIAGAAFVMFSRARVTPTDQRRWKQLTNLDFATQPALSPDGRLVAFIRGQGTFTTEGQIYVKMLPDGEPVPLTNDAHIKMSPVFSPDGSRIAYTVNDAEPWSTWVVPTLRGEPHRWMANASGLTWAGGDQLLFSEIKRGQHMAIVAASAARSASNDIYVPEDELGMAHRSYRSPDGRNVVLVEMDAKGRWLPCRVVPFDGRSRGKPVGPPGAPCTSAAWSTDGKWLYLSASDGSAFHLWRQRFPDGRPEQLTDGPTEEEGIAVDPDGRSLITSVGLRQRAVWIHDGKDERQVSVEGYAYAPLLSSDGRTVCYRVTSNAGTGQTPGVLWCRDVRSGRAEQVIPGQLVTLFDVSQNGRIIAAVEGKGGRELWIGSIDGREPPRRIPNVAGDTPRWVPNGDIVFRAAEGSGYKLYRIRPDGSGREALSPVTTSVFGTASPDGRWISAADVQGMSLQSTRGEDPIVFMRGAPTGRVRWSPDGSHLWVSVQVGEASGFAFGRTYVIPLRQGEVLPPIPPDGFAGEEALAALPGAQVLPYGDVGPGSAPDRYAFSRTLITRNLYRIPLPE